MKRPQWRRLVRILLITLASVIVVLLILLGVLHTSVGKRFVRGRIAAQLARAIDGTVALGSVEYGFLFSHLELKDLVIHDREGKDAIRIAHLHVVVDRGSLLHGAPVIEDLAIDGLEATIVQTADGKTNLTGLFKPSGSAPPASITVSTLHLAGSARVTRPDGTVISIADLAITGSATVKSREQTKDLLLSGVSAKITLAVPKAPVRTLELSIATVLLEQRAGAVETTIASFSFGALTVERLHAALALADGKPTGAQAISITNAKLDHRKLTTMLGKELIVDDVKFDASMTGPLDKLVVHGGVVIRQTTLDLDGTVDLSRPALPRYEVTLVGKGTSTDLLAHAPNVPPIQTDVKLAAVGSGFVVPDLDANLTLEVGPTQIGSISVEGVSAKMHAQKGGIVLERLHAKGLGFTLDASGDVAADTTLHGSLTVAGSPVEASRVLRVAGIAAWYRVPLLPHVEVTVIAAGKPGGALLLEIRPVQLRIAGGSIRMAGNAALDHRVVTHASTTIGLHGLDLGALARLAHRPAPKVKGSLSGSIAVQRIGDEIAASYDLTIALHDLAIVAKVHGRADRAAADLFATIVARGTSLAKVTAHVAHDDQGLLPDRAWKVSIDAPQRALTELLALAPPELRAQLASPDGPEGDVALRGNLAGTPNHPTGSIHAIAHVATPAGPQVAQLRAVFVPHGAGTKLETHVEVGPPSHEPSEPVRELYAQPRSQGTAAEDATPFVIIDGAITLPPLFRGRQLDVAGLRSGVAFDETLTLPEHELAHLPLVSPQIARLGGTIGGNATITGTPLAPQLRAAVTWRGYPIISGLGTTELTLAGTPLHLDANVTSGPISIHTSVTRTGKHFAVETQLHAEPSPLVAMLPESLVPALHGVQPGTLRSDLVAKLALAMHGKRVSLEAIDVTGSLSVSGGTLAIPNSARRWHDLELVLAGTPDGLRLTKLSAREGTDRSLEISGFLVVKQDHDAAGALSIEPDKAHLEVAMHDWLALGFGSPLLSDAPVATVNLAAQVDANLSTPVIALDATISKLDFAQPDRLEHSHEPEQWQVTGDVIYSADKSGALPVMPMVASATHHVVPLDVRIHIPDPIHVLKSPLDLFAKGELAVAVRDTGIETRGTVEVTGGKLQLFHRDHHVVSGSIVFDDAHPHGNFALAFEYELPPEVVRELAHTGARVNIAGPPTKPQLSFGGAVNSTLAETLTTYHAGHPVYLSWPGLYPSTTAEVQSGFTYYIFGFLANALPHLLFLDRAVGWADPNEPRGAYGRIRNLELEGYASDRTARARVVGRPTEPGRSTAELQLDHLWVDSNQLLVGAGVRAGDRVGGGVGLFFEWSSAR